MIQICNVVLLYEPSLSKKELVAAIVRYWL